MRVAITGVPRGGKSLLSLDMADELGIEPQHADALRRADNRWDLQAEECLEWLAQPAPWIIEGITLLPALLRWNSEPDVIVWLDTPHIPLSRGQEVLARKCREWWGQLSPSRSLVLHGVDEAHRWVRDGG